MSITSFRYERSLIESFGGKKLPVFITETGWTAEKIPDNVRGDYYYQALQNVWNDPGIVTVAPFLLRAGSGPFEQFTFIKADGSETKQYTTVKNFPKVKGTPITPPPPVLAQAVVKDTYPLMTFETEPEDEKLSLSETVQTAFKWIMKL